MIPEPISTGQLFLTLEYATSPRPAIPWETTLEDAIDKIDEMMPIIACVVMANDGQYRPKGRPKNPREYYFNYDIFKGYKPKEETLIDCEITAEQAFRCFDNGVAVGREEGKKMVNEMTGTLGYITTDCGECKRCHKKRVSLLSNGYCHRCDDVIFGKKIEKRMIGEFTHADYEEMQRLFSKLRGIFR